MRWIRMVAAEGKLWLAAADLRTSGYGFVYDPARDEVSKLQDIGFSGFGVNGVAATRDSVYFAGNLGLYRFDTNGVLRKHYDQKQAAMPGNRILDVCEGGGNMVFFFPGFSHTRRCRARSGERQDFRAGSLRSRREEGK